MVASVTAGPSMLLVIILYSLLESRLQAESSLDILGIVPMVVVFGSIISFVPSLLGTTVMFLLSRRYPFARRRSMWAAAGAIGAIALVPWWSSGAGDLLSALSLAIVGACCAIICHIIARPD
jgi:xanthosine utilization system XapX-like protein